MTTVLVLLYPFLVSFDRDLPSLLQWVFMTPSYSIHLRILPILVWIGLSGPLFFMFWQNWSKEFIKNNYPILVPILFTYVLYSLMVPTWDYYINQFTSYLPIIIVVVLSNKSFTLLRNRIFLVAFILLAIINIWGASYVFHLKTGTYENIRRFIQSTVPTGSYIFSPQIPVLIELLLPEYKSVHHPLYAGTSTDQVSAVKNAIKSDAQTKIFLLDINASPALSTLGEEARPSITQKVATRYHNNDEALWHFIHKPLSFGNYLTLYSLSHYP
jgi:hypothetical protein